MLIADDTDDNRELLRRWIELFGHRVTTVGDGRAALDTLRTQPFDLLLLDLMMPEMSGYEVLEQLISDPILRRTPVVVVSVLDDIESIARCIKLGAVDHLFKPINPVLLKARVTTCITNKRLSDQEQRAKQALEAASTAKSDFINLVGHEVKTPLTTIIGYTELLLGQQLGPLNDQQQQCLRTILNSGNLMASLVTDLSDLSSIEAGQIDLFLQPLSLPSIIAMVTQTFDQQLRAKKQLLGLQIAENLPRIQGDRTRLVQVLNNLLSNAMKYTPEGGSIMIAASYSHDDLVQLVVRDTGMGISIEDQRRLFQKFFRAAEVVAQQIAGTGLGLNITRQLIELHGGDIRVESTLGSGTSIFVTLPVART